MSTEEVVVSFVASLGVCMRALQGHTTGVARESPTEPLMAYDVAGQRRRRGVIAGVGSFELHGTGCTFEMESGEVVSFDWDEDSRVVFDWWRIRGYAQSLGAGELVEADVLQACRALAEQELLLEIPSGQFAVRARLDEAT